MNTGLPALPGTRNTLDDLAPLRQNVVNLARQASEVARVDVAPFETRLQAKADDLARSGLYVATAELLQTALHRLIEAAYERVGDQPVGMDPDGRLIVTAPWSKRNHTVYGLRRSQADLLRTIITNWQAAHAAGQFKVAPIFIRDDITHKWYVNLAYTDVRAAHQAVGGWLSPQYVRRVELALQQTRTAGKAQPDRNRTAGKA